MMKPDGAANPKCRLWQGLLRKGVLRCPMNDSQGLKKMVWDRDVSRVSKSSWQLMIDSALINLDIPNAPKCLPQGARTLQ